MKRSAFLLLLLLLPAYAQQPMAEPAAEAEQDEDAAPLPSEEVLLRSGIIILNNIYRTLVAVHDHQTAQAAVPVLVRLTHELQAWARSMATLPPLSEENKAKYEARYLPIIRQINEHLRVQGERLAASEYFGSQDLSTALMSLYISAQQ